MDGTLRHYRATEQVLARCSGMVEKSDELLNTGLLTLIDLCSHAAKNKNSNVGRWMFSGSRALVLDYSVPMPCTPGWAQQSAMQCPERVIDPSLSDVLDLPRVSHKPRRTQYLQSSSLSSTQGSQLWKWSTPATVSSNSSLPERSNAVNMA